MTNRRFSSPRFCMLMVAFFTIITLAVGARIPAYVFPDEKSDVITHLRVSENDLKNYSRVLDPTLKGTWYWTTLEDKFDGYVNKDDIDNNNKLKDGAVIRVQATYSSWPLTKYQEGDKIKVRSRRSVGRVSITKEIPVYFRFDKPAEKSKPVIRDVPQKPASIAKPAPVVVEETPAPADGPDTELASTALPEEQPEEAAITKTEPEAPVETVAEVPETDVQEAASDQVASQEETYSDPLLEETPRMSAQELAAIAPPPADLFQEFEGYLRIVALGDPMAGVFRYQLETRSGRRIVYVDTAQLINESFLEYVDAWINVRGTLEETQPEQTLYIEAKDIWVAP